MSWIDNKNDSNLFLPEVIEESIRGFIFLITMKIVSPTGGPTNEMDYLIDNTIFSAVFDGNYHSKNRKRKRQG